MPSLAVLQTLMWSAVRAPSLTYYIIKSEYILRNPIEFGSEDVEGTTDLQVSGSGSHFLSSDYLKILVLSFVFKHHRDINTLKWLTQSRNRIKHLQMCRSYLIYGSSLIITLYVQVFQETVTLHRLWSSTGIDVSQIVQHTINWIIDTDYYALFLLLCNEVRLTSSRIQQNNQFPTWKSQWVSTLTYGFPDS